MNATSPNDNNSNGFNLISPRESVPMVSPRATIAASATTTTTNHAPHLIPEQVTLLQKEFNPHHDLELNFLVECNLKLLIPTVESIGKPVLPKRRASRAFSRMNDLQQNFGVRLVSCGSNHTIIVTNNGDLYSTGANSEGQLGLGDFCDRFIFSKINVCLEQAIQQLHCQFNHSAIITTRGELFVCGSNANAELGKLKYFLFLIHLFFPTLSSTNIFNNFIHHAIYITNPFKSSMHNFLIIIQCDLSLKTFSCMKIIIGLLLPKAKVSVFSQVPLNTPVKSIRFTIDCTVVLSTDGDLYSCGIGGELNDQNFGDSSTWMEEKRFTMYRKISIIPSFKKVNIPNEKFEQIHCGATFTLASTANDDIFVFNNGSTTTANSSGEEYSPRHNANATTVNGSLSTSVMDYYRQSMLLPNKNSSSSNQHSTKPFKTFRLKAKETDDIPFTTKIKDICCGYHHVMITDYLDQFYGLGRNDDGRLGFLSKRPSSCDSSNKKQQPNAEKKPIYVNEVKRVEFSNRLLMQTFNSVACGEKFTIFYNKMEEEFLKKRKTHPIPLKPLFMKRVHTSVKETSLNVFLPLLQQSCPSLAQMLSEKGRCVNVSQPSDVPLLQLLIDTITNEQDLDHDHTLMNDGSKLLRLLFLLSIYVKSGEQVHLKMKILWKLLNLIDMENVNIFLKDIVSCMEEMDHLESSNFSSHQHKINSTILKTLNECHEMILHDISNTSYKWMFLLGEYCKDLLDMSLDVKSEFAQQLVKQKLPNLFKNTSLTYSIIVGSELSHAHPTLTTVTTLGSTRKSLYNHQETSDIKVALNHHRSHFIQAHKTILASCSPVLDSFLRKFSSDLNDDTNHNNNGMETLDLYSLCFGSELHLLNRNFTQKALELSLQLMYDCDGGSHNDCDNNTTTNSNSFLSPFMGPKDGIDLFFCMQIVALKLQSSYLQQKGFEILELLKKNFVDDHTISLVERALDFMESYKLQDSFKEDFTRVIVRLVNDKWSSLSARCRSRDDWKYILQLFYNVVEEEQYYGFL